MMMKLRIGWRRIRRLLIRIGAEHIRHQSNPDPRAKWEQDEFM